MIFLVDLSQNVCILKFIKTENDPENGTIPDHDLPVLQNVLK